MHKIWEKAEEEQQLLRVLDGVDIDKHIIATYYIEAPLGTNITAYTQGIALEQTTGTWVRVRAETMELREKHAGKIVGIYEIPTAPTSRIFQIAYPVENIEPNMPILLSTVIGNISWWGTGIQDTALKLVDLRFPKSWLKEFKGPKFGVEGLRKYMDIPERPILNNMIKPCTGHTTDVHVELFKEAAYGGIDHIKDDELLADPPFNPFFDRLAKCMEIVDRKYEETGEKTLYTINVTDRVDKLLEKAEKAVQAGANALMLDSGNDLSALRMLAEDPSIKVPILYHNAYVGAQTVNPKCGMTVPLHIKLQRICGADIPVWPVYLGKFPTTRETSVANISACHSPLLHIKPSMPLPGGGIHPGLVPQLIADFGLNIIVGAGGAVHSHPMGPRAGAKAFRQAIDAIMKGIPLEEAAKENKELLAALEKWGIPRTLEEATKIFDLRGGKRPT
jgi:2,3-diketo-5-methylthiopentyl-1-phosphate enolase